MAGRLNNLLVSRVLVTGLALLGVGGLGTGCSKEEPGTPRTATETPAVITGDTPLPPEASVETFSVESISRGALVFQERCAECHGPQGQGHPDWSPDRKGTPVAPPLDGTGTVQRLSRKRLEEVIRLGVVREKVPVMPAWQGRLSQQDMDDVITWFQATWPPEIYKAWQAKNGAPSPQAAK